MANPKANDYAGYHSFCSIEGDKYGSFEVFWNDGRASANDPYEPGWYWWGCFPGCLPDGVAIGPFATSGDAYRDALEG